MCDKMMYHLVCPICGEKFTSVKLGEKSYVEVECPHCKATFSALSTSTGIKTKVITSPSKKSSKNKKS